MGARTRSSLVGIVVIRHRSVNARPPRAPRARHNADSVLIRSIYLSPAVPGRMPRIPCAGPLDFDAMASASNNVLIGCPLNLAARSDPPIHLQCIGFISPQPIVYVIFTDIKLSLQLI
jgi:hypothetical protein